MSRYVIDSLSFSARAIKGGAQEILRRDRSRAQRLLQPDAVPHGPKLNSFTQQSFAAQDPSNTSSISVVDAGVTYVTDVDVGSPATKHTLLIDTGSSNTWIGAQTKYVPTKTSQDTRETFQVTYGSGSVSGTEYLDTVSLGKNLTIEKQSIGVASKADGMDDIDGILGIGPDELTIGSLSNNNEVVPTVVTNLYNQKTIPTPSIGISYIPTTSTDQLPNGELTFGGTDHEKYTGSLNYVPVTSTEPASKYWGVDQTLTYGDDTQLLKSSGILDTGTTLLLLASDSFQKYQKATGASLDQSTGLLTVTEAQYDKLESLFFEIGGQKYEFTKNAQRWPKALNSIIGGSADKIYLVTADLGDIGSGGLDFINGFSWLQRFYTVYDWSDGGRIGIAPTEYTSAETN